jgi:hypothetical protein
VIVKCLTNSTDDLPESYVNPTAGYPRGKRVATLEPGREYLVYAVGVFGTQVWYYVCEAEDDPYPAGRPAPFFSTVDGAGSRFWSVDFRPDNPICQLLVAPVEWIGERDFYQRLTDYGEREMAIFAGIRAKMDEEARRPR